MTALARKFPFSPVAALVFVLVCGVPVSGHEPGEGWPDATRPYRHGLQHDRQGPAAVAMLGARPQDSTQPLQLSGESKFFELRDNPVRGEPAVDLVLIEFVDYMSRHSYLHFKHTLPRILSDYVDRGALRYAVFDKPQEDNPRSLEAAEAAACAGDQGKFWKMHERLLTRQKSAESWEAHAGALGLDTAAFKACMSGGGKTGAVRFDMEQVAQTGVKGTPFFILGRPDPADPARIVGVSWLKGALPYQNFQQSIDSILRPSP